MKNKNRDTTHNEKKHKTHKTHKCTYCQTTAAHTQARRSRNVPSLTRQTSTLTIQRIKRASRTQTAITRTTSTLIHTNRTGITSAQTTGIRERASITAQTSTHARFRGISGLHKQTKKAKTNIRNQMKSNEIT